MKQSKTVYWHQSLAKRWDIYTSPIRPSRSELAFWKSHMKKRSRNNIPKTLILGATPELRDLAHALGHEVMLVDVSLDMVSAMKTLMKNKQSKETIVLDDWIHAPIEKNYFDYVLGDFVVVNLPFELQEKFLKKIADLLKRGGLFIHRHWTVPIKKDPKRILDFYLHKNLKVKQTRNEFADALNKSSYDPKDYSVSLKRTRKFLSRFTKYRKLITIYKEVYNGDKVWWATPAKIIENMQNKQFKQIAIGKATDHAEADEDPIYVLKK